MNNQTKKSYRKLVGMLLLKKFTNLGLFVLLAVEGLFLYGYMVQVISFSGIVTVAKNPFYPETIRNAVTNMSYTNLFSAILIVILLFAGAALIGAGKHKELTQIIKLAIYITVPIGGLIYFWVNEESGLSVAQTMITWYLIPLLISVCIMQLTTVSIEKIKQQIIQESDLFSLEGITLEYEGLSQEWNKYLYIQKIVKTIDYDVAYPLIDKESDNTQILPDILSEIPRTVVTVRVKNTLFELELGSAPKYRYKETGALERRRAA